MWLGGTETTNFAKLSALARLAVNTFPDEISRSRVVATYICSVFSPDEAATGVSTSGPGLAAQPTKMKENRTAIALSSLRQRKLLHMETDSPTKPTRTDTIALGPPRTKPLSVLVLRRLHCNGLIATGYCPYHRTHLTQVPPKSFFASWALFERKRSNSRRRFIEVKRTSRLRAPKSEND